MNRNIGETESDHEIWQLDTLDRNIGEQITLIKNTGDEIFMIMHITGEQG